MVSVMNVRPDPSIAVGTPVLAATSKLGTAVDVAAVEKQALAAHASGRRATTSRSPSTPRRARCPSRAPCGSSSSATSSDGRAATRSRGSSRRCASASTSTRASSTARTSRTASASRRGSPSGCSPPAPTRSRSATTRGGATRSARISPSSTSVVRPANFHDAAPGRGLDRRRGPGRHAGRGDQPPRVAVPRPGAQHVGDRRRPRRGGAGSRRRSSSSTSTPRRRARRSRSRAWLDGRVTAVLGTHTHVQTSDARVLPGWDGGGDGRRHDRARTTRVIGVADRARDPAHAHRHARAVRDRVGGVRLEGALVTCDPETGRASAIEPVRAPWPGHMSTASSASERQPRASTSHEASGSNSLTSSQ